MVKPDGCLVVLYSAVKAGDAIVFEDVREGSQHAFGAIGGSRLEADL